MNKPTTYNFNDETIPIVAEESSASFMKNFSSQEESDLYRLQKNISMSDMEKFQRFCRLMRINKMLSNSNSKTNSPDK